MTVTETKAKLRAPKPSGLDWSKGLSTSLTLLNLSFSGQADVGFLPGCYYLLVGDSASGKTFLALSAMAEATINPVWKKHRLIYDEVEGGALMDLGKFFGLSLPSRLERRHPQTVEEFYDSCLDDFEKGPCFRVLDSNDSLECSADLLLAKKRKVAREKGKEEPGSYGAEKAKRTKQGLRRLVGPLAKHGSVLVIISQTIDNLGFGFEKKTRAGGRALRFFAAGEAWFSIKGSIKKTVRDIPRKVGSILQIQVKKNRQTGREPVVEIPFYPSVGFDDVGACVDYLVKEGHWKESRGVVDAPEMGHHCSREKLVQAIEGEGKEGVLRELVKKVWTEIEEACFVVRKPRYS